MAQHRTAPPSVPEYSSDLLKQAAYEAPAEPLPAQQSAGLGLHGDEQLDMELMRTLAGVSAGPNVFMPL